MAESNLNLLSKASLLQKCEELGIKKCKSKTKGELIDLIEKKLNPSSTPKIKKPTIDPPAPAPTRIISGPNIMEGYKQIIDIAPERLNELMPPNRSKIIMDYDQLYDTINDELEINNEELFKSNLNGLIENSIIEQTNYNDTIMYNVINGLNWNEFIHDEDTIKKHILQCLCENNKAFFVILNTQQGKSNIMATEIEKWIYEYTIRVIPIIIVENDKHLLEQTTNAITRKLGKENIEILSLSSSSKCKVKEIERHLDSYDTHSVLHGDGTCAVPIIMLLNNPIQIKKLLKIFNYIDTQIKKNRQCKLRPAPIFDEADKTYPTIRNNKFMVELTSTQVEEMRFEPFIKNPTFLYKLGFITATEGELLIRDSYPECYNAHVYHVEIPEEDKIHYRAMHHPESRIHIVEYKNNNNLFAIDILNNNIHHFNTPIRVPSGESYYRKIIINSNNQMKDMTALAKYGNSLDMYSLVFNGEQGSSVKLYQAGAIIKSYKPKKGKSLNELLMYIYKRHKLNDKPLIIIGHRKVDRGIGFHFSPRRPENKILDFGNGEITLEPMDSLIFTDMILGKISNKYSAVQKAGRLAGIIGQSRQYHGHIDYWTDQSTCDDIIEHNNIVDIININNRKCSDVKMGDAHKSAYAMYDIILEEAIPIEEAIPGEDIEGEDIEDKSMTVPIVIQITEDQFKSIRDPTTGNTRWNYDNLFNSIPKNISDELQSIRDKPIDNECPNPTTKGYKKKITDYVDSWKGTKKRKTWATEISQNPFGDYYTIYLDQLEYRIIISIYYGSKNKVNAVENVDSANNIEI